MDQKSISKAVIRRLPRYYRYLGELMEEGVERISSNELSEKMRVTACCLKSELLVLLYIIVKIKSIIIHFICCQIRIFVLLFSHMHLRNTKENGSL